MKDLDIDLIICSPLLRARHTCNIVNVNNIEVIYDKRIEERDWGTLTNTKIDECCHNEYWNYYSKVKIEGLEKGIDTIIGREFDEDGLEFSGGEGQKLACARAYYKDSPIMILDEPTASLDPISECQLYERFNSILENKTAIYISHRLASVKFCNKVAMFADGRLAEYGTHESLMEQNGLYAEMFTKQAEYYRGDTKHEE